MNYHLRKAAIFLMAFVSVAVLRGQSPFGILLYESFEEGRIPDGWITEYGRGSQNWVVEEGGSNPDKAYDGRYRLAFRNSTGVTSGSVTRLVLPVVDVTDLIEPQLCMAFAQKKWTNDFDVLRVLYRHNPEAEWQILKSYDRQYVSYWTLDTLDLSAFSPTSQLAFEATDNLGYGIVIDKVEIRSAPICSKPYSLSVDTVRNDRAVLKWAAGIDASAYRVCVSAEPVSKDQLADPAYKAPVKDVIVPGGDNNKKECLIDGLEAMKTYYVCMQSHCHIGDNIEMSDWSDVLEFTTTNIAVLPYTEKFNLPYTGQPMQIPTWTFGTSIKNMLIPFVNTNENNEFNLAQFSRDTSTCLAFALPNSISEGITENEYAYAATPELDVDDVSKLEVRFWISDKYVVKPPKLSRIIVGVMTNPRDFRTFVAVDTVALTKYYMPDEHLVSLESYTGSGKYVAFVSDFDNVNRVYLDDVHIQVIPQLRREDNFKVSLFEAGKMTVSWDRHGAAGGEVLISEAVIEDFSAASSGIKGFTGASYTADVEPATTYFVYVRNVNGSGKGEWSKYRLIHTPAVFTEEQLSKPVDLTAGYRMFFDSWATADNIPGTVSLITGIHDHQQLLSNNNTFTVKCFQPGDYAYVVFPELPGDVKGLRACIMAKAPVATGTSTIKAGLMSDAGDAASFELLNTVVVTGDATNRIVVPFDAATGDDGRFFAIRVDDGLMIEKIVFEPIPNCSEAKNVEVIPGATDAVIEWDGNGAENWRVRVSSVNVPYDSLANERTNYKYVYDGLAQSPDVTVNGLSADGVTYYAYVQTVCDGQPGEWTSAVRFVTECHDKQPLPYVQNFDRPDYATGANHETFTVPCMYTQPVKSGSSSYYPSLSTIKHNGRASLYFYSSSTLTEQQYIILPEMERPINELQIEMHLRSNKADIPLTIGAVKNTDGLSTFDSITEVHVTATSKFIEYRLPLNDYQGNGRYIALRPDVSAQFYIDSLVVREIEDCTWTMYPVVRAVHASSAIAEWRHDSSASSWDMVVATKALNVTELNTAMAAPEGSVVNNVHFHGTVSKCPYTITGLKASVTYYYYVRTSCGEGDSPWSEVCQFTTACETVDAGEFGVEDFETGLSKCWTVGNITNNKVVAYKPSAVGGNNASGENSLKILSTTQYNGAYAITPMFDIDDIRKLQVHFYAKVDANSLGDRFQQQLQVGVATDPADPGTFEYVDTIDGFFDGKYYTVPLDRYDGQDYMGNAGKHIIFMSYFGKDNTIFIDDVWVDTIPECRLPQEISFTDLTSTSVSVSWDATHAPYIVKVSDRILTDDELNAGEDPEGVETFGNINKESLDIEDLAPVTSYYIYLQGGCNDGGRSNWSDPYILKTACPDAYALPYVQDFDESVNRPDCWDAFCTNPALSYPVFSVNPVRGASGKSWQMYANVTDSTYSVLPVMDVDNISACQLIFHAYGNVSYSRGFIIGAVSDISSDERIAETFEPIETVRLAASGEWQKVNVSLKNYKGNGRYIAFVSSYKASDGNAGTVNIDDFTVIERPACAAPDFFSLLLTTDQTAIVEFKDYAGANGWEIRYGEPGFSVEEDNAGTTVAIDNERDTVTGLVPATGYDLYVRAVCSDTEYSEWVGPLYVKTTPTPTVAPYDAAFEDEEKNKAWTFISDVNAWCIGSANIYGDEGKAMYVSDDNGVTARYKKNLQGLSYSYAYAYIPVRIEEGQYTFSYDWKGVGESNSDYMRVGLLPADIVLGGNEGGLFRNGERLGSLDSRFSATDVEEYVPLEGKDTNGRIRRYLSGATDWVHNEVSLSVKSETAGVYNLVVFWSNQSGFAAYGAEPSMIIDNLNIDYTPCVSPTELRLVSVDSVTATVAWKDVEAHVAYDVVITNNPSLANPDEAGADDKKFAASKITEANVKATGLEPWMQYRIFVRSYCSLEGEPGKWSEPMSFRTMCGAQPSGVLYDFENTDDSYDYKDGITVTFMPNCFTRLHPTIDLAGYTGNAAVAGIVSKYNRNRHSRGNGNFSLNFESANANEKGGCVVLPAIDEDITTKQLTFWMRPFTLNENGTGVISLNNLNKARSITVGTLDVANDLSTFKRLGTVTYPFTSADITNSTNMEEFPEHGWVKFTLSLEKAEGKYIVFCNDGFEGYSNTVYIDDVIVEDLAEKYNPYGMNVGDISDETAKFTWAADGGTSWIVQLSTSASMEDTIVVDTVTVKEYLFDNLQSGSDYYVSVCTVNAETGLTSDMSAAMPFTTQYRVRFTESFSQAVASPKHWVRAEGMISDVFDGGKPVVITDTYKGWLYSFGDASAPDGHYEARDLGMSYDYGSWLISPEIRLADTEHHTLIFDLALSDSETGEALPESEKGALNKAFMVAVSTDGGETWKEDNTAVWSNGQGAAYLLDDVPFAGKRYTVDLSQYKGQAVKVAFYAETRSISDAKHKNIIHLDNIRINSAVVGNHSVGLCETEDFCGYGLDLKDTDLSVNGDNVYEDYIFSAAEDKPDTMQTVTITVDPLGMNTVHSIICHGRRYTEDGFDVAEAGVYKKKIRREGQCDSVIVLTLEVVEPATSITVDSVCEGYSYTWGGKEYNRPGTYNDTLQMAGLECDSIATLVLSVIPTKVHGIDKSVCFGDSYVWGDTTLTTSGVYRRRFATGMCDSVVELKFTVNPDYRKTYREIICRGDKFTGYGFKDVFGEGEHTLPLKSKDGCDSTIVLILTEIGGDTTYVADTVTVDELPYEYQDLYYGENTRPGIYRDTLTVESENCKSAIIHTLVVRQTTGVDVVYADVALVIVPNPANSGTEVILDIDLIQDERDGAYVDLYSATGVLVSSEPVAGIGEIRVKCDIPSGIYLVRLTTASGHQYHGRIIVK